MKQRLVQAATAALLFGVFPAANATPTLSFSLDGGAAILCADGDACDSNLAAGAVTFIGVIGDFSINVTTGISKPILTGDPLMDINSVNIQTTGDGQTLVMMFSDDDFGVEGLFSGLFGGTLSGAGATILAEAYYDAANTLFALTTPIGDIGPFGPGAFSGSFGGAVTAPDSPYSVTQVLTLTTAGATTFSGDFEISVPEPGTLALMGLALVGLALRRRRQPSAC